MTHRYKRAHESKCLSAFGLPTPSALPVPSDKAAAADLGKVYLGWVQMVRKYDDINSKVNLIPKLHNDINIMTYLLSNSSIFTVSGVNKVTQIVLVNKQTLKFSPKEQQI